MKISRLRIVSWILLHSLVFYLGVSGASAYSYSGYKWPSTSTSYYINNAFAASFQTAMRTSDATWDASGSRFRFNYAGTTSRNPNIWSYSSDGYSDIGYTDAGNNGKTASTSGYASGSTLEEIDTTFNTYYGLTTVGAAGKHDVQDIMTHDFGHWLFLLDRTSTSSPSYCGSSSRVTMCSANAAGETYRRSLQTDDKNGIKAIYGI
jgi:hypothetical protein